MHSALAQRGTNLLRIHTANALLHTLKTCNLSIQNSKEKGTRKKKNTKKPNKLSQINKASKQTKANKGHIMQRERGRER